MSQPLKKFVNQMNNLSYPYQVKYIEKKLLSIKEADVINHTFFKKLQIHFLSFPNMVVHKIREEKMKDKESGSKLKHVVYEKYVYPNDFSVYCIFELFDSFFIYEDCDDKYYPIKINKEFEFFKNWNSSNSYEFDVELRSLPNIKSRLFLDKEYIDQNFSCAAKIEILTNNENNQS